MIKKIQNKLKRDIHLSDLLKGSAITFVLKMFGVLISYILMYIISKKNGAEGIGYFNIFSQIINVLSLILCLGMNISVLRFIGQYNNEKDLPKLHLLYRLIVKIIVPITIFVAIVLFFGADYFSQLIFKTDEYSTIFKLVAIILPFYTMNQISVEFIRGLKKLQISEFIRSVTRPAFMVFVFILFWSRAFSNVEIIYLLVAGSVLNSMLSRGAIWFQLQKIPKIPQPDFSPKTILNTSSSLMITSSSNALMTALPIFFLDYYISKSDVGIFTVSYRIALGIPLVLLIVNTIAAPKFATLFHSGKKEELQKLISQSSKLMFWVALVISLVIIGCSGWILKIFGDEFVKGKWELIILVIGQMVNVATGSVGVFMNMSGHQKIYRNFVLITLIISIISYAIVIPRFGIFSAAIISSSGLILVNVLTAYYVKAKLDYITFYLPFLSYK